jgi:hypothetical protein
MASKTYTLTVNDEHVMTTTSTYNPLARNHRYIITCTCGARMSTISASTRNEMESDHIAVASR